MPSYTPAKKNTAFVMYVALTSQANTKLQQVNPTIAAGDFRVSKDGGALTNFASLPAVEPSSSRLVKLALSATEMDADNVTIVCSDASGAEWCDLTINIRTAASQFDDLATAASIAALNDLSAAEINAEVDTALADYDAPTKAELDAAQSAIQADIATAQADLDNPDQYKADVSALATAANLATLDGKADTILADTNELQTDWTNGGRLDLLIDAIKAKTDNLPTDPADASDIAAAIAGLNDISVSDLLAATIEGGESLQDTLIYLLALTGKTSGGGTTEVTFYGVDGTTPRLTYTVDENGNRSVVTRDAT